MPQATCPIHREATPPVHVVDGDWYTATYMKSERSSPFTEKSRTPGYNSIILRS